MCSFHHRIYLYQLILVSIRISYVTSFLKNDSSGLLGHRLLGSTGGDNRSGLLCGLQALLIFPF